MLLDFVPLAEFTEFFVAFVEELGGGEGAEVVEVFGDDVSKGECGGVVVVVGAADGLWDDVINELELEEVWGDELHGFCGFWGVFAVFPEDGGAAFW